MTVPSIQFFACTGFAGNQNSAVRCGNSSDEFDCLLHGSAVTDDHGSYAGLQCNRFACRDIVRRRFIQMRINAFFQFGIRHRHFEIIICTRSDKPCLVTVTK